MDRIEHLLSTQARATGSSAIRDLLHLLERPDMLSLAGGLPAAEVLPVDRVHRAFDAAIERSDRYGATALQYGPTEGVADLRAWVGADARRVDGRSDASDVLVTTGSQQAIDLLARVLIDPGDVVVVERPAYLGSLQALRAAQASFVAITSDEHGLRTDELEVALHSGLRPKLCTVVPNFQNPSGATMSPERRAHLGALAEHYGFVVVEDDPYRVLRFRGEQPAPIRRHTELAVTLGSTSKLLAPGLRVGWAIAPPPLLAPLVRAKQSADLHTSTTTQLLALEMLTDASFLEQHIERLRACYSERCNALVDAVRDELPAAQFSVPDGGFFVWLRLPGIDTTALLPRALDHGVAFVPGTAFTTDGTCSEHARLSFASLDVEDLREAVRRLATAAGVTRKVTVPAPA